jgi:hypothetical protein
VSIRLKIGVCARDSPFLQLRIFNVHISEFAGFEDFAAFQAFHEFGVLFAGDDFHARVLTLCHFATHAEGLAGLDGVIDSSLVFVRTEQPRRLLPELAVFLAGRA